MPAYKDEKQNTWYCQFYYEDWQGNKKKKQKRGFKTKKEALEWERNCLKALVSHPTQILKSASYHKACARRFPW